MCSGPVACCAWDCRTSSARSPRARAARGTTLHPRHGSADADRQADRADRLVRLGAHPLTWEFARELLDKAGFRRVVRCASGYRQRARRHRGAGQPRAREPLRRGRPLTRSGSLVVLSPHWTMGCSVAASCSRVTPTASSSPSRGPAAGRRSPHRVGRRGRLRGGRRRGRRRRAEDRAALSVLGARPRWLPFRDASTAAPSAWTRWRRPWPGPCWPVGPRRSRSRSASSTTITARHTRRRSGSSARRRGALASLRRGDLPPLRGGGRGRLAALHAAGLNPAPLPPAGRRALGRKRRAVACYRSQLPRWRARAGRAGSTR